MRCLLTRRAPETFKLRLDILNRQGNADDIYAYLRERNLPLEEIGLQTLTERIMSQRPLPGYLTISNALQWRLQYQRVIAFAKENKPGAFCLLCKAKTARNLTETLKKSGINIYDIRYYRIDAKTRFNVNRLKNRGAFFSIFAHV